jgi:predicted RND superfamily exporter protein
MDKYIRFVLDRPKTVLVFFIVITLILAAGMFKLKFDTSIATFLPQHDEEYKYYNRVKEIYGDCDTFVILSVSHKNLWQHETFAHIDNLLVDLEEFKNYDPSLQQQRISALDALLSNSSVSGKDILETFANDPAFQRLIHRKLQKIGMSEGALNAWSKKRLQSAVAADDQLMSLQLIDEIISPFTVKDITGDNDMLTTIDLIPTDDAGRRILPKTRAEFQSYMDRLRRNPVFEKGIYAVDTNGNITDLGFIIRFKDISDSDAISREILEIVDSHKELTIVPQGQPIIYIWINDYMQQDLMKLVPLVILITMIVFFLNFRSIRGVVLPTLTLLMTTAWVLGLMGHLGFKITTVGISIPILMIAVGSSYAIHILNQYYAEYDLITKQGKYEGLHHAMNHISVTVLLAGFTTVVSFLTLATHQLPALREWGIFSGLGIAFAVLISASIIPAGLELMSHKKEGPRFLNKKQKRFSIVDRLIQWAVIGSTVHYKKVIAVVSILMVFSIIGLLQLKVETELLHYFKKDNYIRTSAREICDKFGGRWGFNILIDSGKPDGIKSAQYLKTITDVRNWLQCCENNDLCIGRTDAFPDYIKTMNMAMNNDTPAYFTVPDNDTDIRDYLEIYSDEDANSDGRVDQFEPYVDPGFQTCNIITRLGQNGDDPIGTAGLKRIFTSISEYLERTLPPGYNFHITGHPSMLIKSVDYIVNGQIQSLVLSLVVIGMTVFFLLKNAKVSMLSLIPMSVAVLFNFGVMGWTGIRLDIATSIIAAITIGIGVDDTIHFLNTFRQYHKPGIDVDMAIRLTLESAGKAIIYTSLALVFGFSVMELSTFKPLVLFGLLMGITMTATTIGALLILPSAIKLTKMGVESIASEAGAKESRKAPVSARLSWIKKKFAEAKGFKIL